MTKQKDINYSVIKASAKQAGVKVNDLLALSPGNDPFYVGKPSDLEKAKWFAEQWNRIGYSKGVHIRRMHYALQAPGTIMLPTRVGWTEPDMGKQFTNLYINNEACWGFLVGSSKAARYLGLVDAGAFVDRQNPDPIIYDPVPDKESDEYVDPSPRTIISGGWFTKEDEHDDDDNDRFGLPGLPRLDDLPNKLPFPPSLYATGYVGTPQKHLLYVFAEKSTMDDILNPLCQQYRVNYVRGKGEMSITSVISFLNQVALHGRPSRILYISDYDPSGIGMPISVARKIEFYLSLLEDEGYDIALKQIVLTQEQIAHYNLPSAPVKTSDKRKGNFEASHGLATELDALEELHPGELHKIVKAEILRYHDIDYNQSLRGALRNMQHALDQEADNVIDNHNEILIELKEEYGNIYLGWQGIREDFDDLVKSFQSEIERFRSALEDITAKTTIAHDGIREDMSHVRIEAETTPEPDLPYENPEALLYDSSREYIEQLENYKRHRSGDS